VWFGVSAKCFKNAMRSAETCFTRVTFKKDMDCCVCVVIIGYNLYMRKTFKCITHVLFILESKYEQRKL
jgi:hypothetical protein